MGSTLLARGAGKKDANNATTSSIAARKTVKPIRQTESRIFNPPIRS